MVYDQKTALGTTCSTKSASGWGGIDYSFFYFNKEKRKEVVQVVPNRPKPLILNRFLGTTEVQ